MALSDTKLRSLLNKKHDKLRTITDRDSLSVRVTPHGKIIFQYRYRFQGKAKRYDLGSYPSISLSEARSTIPELKGIVEKGNDVKAVKSSEKVSAQVEAKASLDDCVELFLAKYVCKLREGTQKTYTYTLHKHACNAIAKPVEDITRKEWYSFFDGVVKNTTEGTANGLIKQLKTCLRFCKARDLINHHSLEEIETRSVGATPNVGDRAPSIKEIKMIMAEFDRTKCYPTTINTVKMLILTGARCGEIRRMERQDIDLETGIWTVPRDKSKTKNKIIRPLGTKALELVNWQLKKFGEFTDYVFPSGSYKNPIGPATVNKMCRAIVKKMEIEKWSVHDFRRSISTILTEEGVQLHVTEKMLGHKLGGILSVYNKSEYIKEQYKAYEVWESLLFSEDD
jgi:integrase